MRRGPALRCSRSLSPFLRGEGRGEGLSPRTRSCEFGASGAPHPNPLPAEEAGRGSAGSVRVALTVMPPIAPGGGAADGVDVVRLVHAAAVAPVAAATRR